MLGGALGAIADGGQGGFGSQILFSAIGQSIDRLVGNLRKLGDSFSSADGTLKQLIDTGFNINKATQKRIELLIKEGKEVEAFLLALDKAGITAGQVENLRALDKSFDELQNSFATLTVTLVSELVPAIVVVTNLIKGFVGSLTGPSIQRAAANLDPAAFQAAQTQAANETSQFGVIGDRAAYEKRLTELSQDIVNTAEIDTSGLERVNILTQENLDLIEKRKAAVAVGNDLTNEAAYIAQRQIVFAETRLAVAEAQGDREKISLALAREGLKLDELRAELADQRAQAAAKAFREAEAAARKEQQVQSSLAQLAVQEFQLIGQTLDVGRTRLEQVEDQRDRLLELERLQTNTILLSNEDSRIKQAKLTILAREIELERGKLNELRTQLLVEKEIQALRTQQEVNGVARGLTQELDRASLLPSGSQFTDQAAQLALAQSQRYENTLVGINDQLELQEKLLKSGTAQQKESAREALPGLLKQKEIYETLLPQIFAACW